MNNSAKVLREVDKLERTIEDIVKAHDYLNEGFVIRFFKGSVLWLIMVFLYFLFVGGILLFLLTIVDEKGIVDEIITSYGDACGGRGIHKNIILRDLLLIRGVLLLLIALFLFMAILVRKIRRKNTTVKFTLDMLEDTAAQLKEHVIDIRNATI